MDTYVKNPTTGRLIKVNGPTYRKLKLNLQAGEVIHKSQPKARQSAKPLSSDVLKQMGEMPIHTFDLKKVLAQTHQPHLIKLLEGQVAKQQKSEKRGQRTRGWSGTAPHRGHQRHQLKEKCGDKCFLIPATEAFPICPKLGGLSSPHAPPCQLSCQGLHAAKIRAHQYKYTDLYQSIDKLLKDKC